MTWIKFALWLAGIYTAYYVVLMLWDHFRSSPPVQSADEQQLTFVEHHEPVRTVDEPVETGKPDSLFSSGGVSLKQMFNLAREDGIQYIRQVSY